MAHTISSNVDREFRKKQASQARAAEAQTGAFWKAARSAEEKPPSLFGKPIKNNKKNKEDNEVSRVLGPYNVVTKVLESETPFGVQNTPSTPQNKGPPGPLFPNQDKRRDSKREHPHKIPEPNRKPVLEKFEAEKNDVSQKNYRQSLKSENRVQDLHNSHKTSHHRENHDEHRQKSKERDNEKDYLNSKREHHKTSSSQIRNRSAERHKDHRNPNYHSKPSHNVPKKHHGEKERERNPNPGVQIPNVSSSTSVVSSRPVDPGKPHKQRKDSSSSNMSISPMSTASSLDAVTSPPTRVSVSPVRKPAKVKTEEVNKGREEKEKLDSLLMKPPNGIAFGEQQNIEAAKKKGLKVQIPSPSEDDHGSKEVPCLNSIFTEMRPYTPVTEIRTPNKNNKKFPYPISKDIVPRPPFSPPKAIDDLENSEQKQDAIDIVNRGLEENQDGVDKDLTVSSDDSEEESIETKPKTAEHIIKRLPMMADDKVSRHSSSESSSSESDSGAGSDSESDSSESEGEKDQQVSKEPLNQQKSPSQVEKKSGGWSLSNFLPEPVNVVTSPEPATKTEDHNESVVDNIIKDLSTSYDVDSDFRDDFQMETLRSQGTQDSNTSVSKNVKRKTVADKSPAVKPSKSVPSKESNKISQSPTSKNGFTQPPARRAATKPLPKAESSRTQKKSSHKSSKHEKKKSEHQKGARNNSKVIIKSPKSKEFVPTSSSESSDDDNSDVDVVSFSSPDKLNGDFRKHAPGAKEVAVGYKPSPKIGGIGEVKKEKKSQKLKPSNSKHPGKEKRNKIKKAIYSSEDDSDDCVEKLTNETVRLSQEFTKPLSVEVETPDKRDTESYKNLDFITSSSEKPAVLSEPEPLLSPIPNIDPHKSKPILKLKKNVILKTDETDASASYLSSLPGLSYEGDKPSIMVRLNLSLLPKLTSKCKDSMGVLDETKPRCGDPEHTSPSYLPSPSFINNKNPNSMGSDSVLDIGNDKKCKSKEDCLENFTQNVLAEDIEDTTCENVPTKAVAEESHKDDNEQERESEEVDDGDESREEGEVDDSHEVENSPAVQAGSDGEAESENQVMSNANSNTAESDISSVPNSKVQEHKKQTELLSQIIQTASMDKVKDVPTLKIPKRKPDAVEIAHANSPKRIRTDKHTPKRTAEKYNHEDNHSWDRKRMGDTRHRNSPRHERDSTKRSRYDSDGDRRWEDRGRDKDKPNRVLDWDAPINGQVENHKLENGIHGAAKAWTSIAAGGPVEQNRVKDKSRHVSEEKLEPSLHYQNEARRLKHTADRLNTRCSRKMTYIESILSYIMCGYATEKDKKDLYGSEKDCNDVFKMYREYLSLITYVIEKPRGQVQAGDKETEKKLEIFTYWIRALLCLRLYRLKKVETANLKKAVDKYNEDLSAASSRQAPSPYQSQLNNRCTGTPSPMSPNPSPSGSVGSVGSGGSANSDANHARLMNGSLNVASNVPPISSSICVPHRIHSITQKYLTYMNYLHDCHEYWDQAVSSSEHCKDFISDLDHHMKPLTIHSSMLELVRYIKFALNLIKEGT